MKTSQMLLFNHVMINKSRHIKSSSWKVTWGGGTYGPTKQSLSGTNWIGRKDCYRGENSGIRIWQFSCKRNKNWKINQTIQGGSIR